MTEAAHTPESSVLDRYSSGAKAREEALCCAVSFDPRYLEVLPDEIVERDYGCGDPTPYVQPGDTVLDLGCGAGKVCWIAAQIVGPQGRIIGVDMNQDMLALAKHHHPDIAGKLGFDVVTFRRGMIQDLKLDLDRLDAALHKQPIRNSNEWLSLRQEEEELRQSQPMIADDSVDVILSNCVLNLVRNEDKGQLFREMYRVLRPGGRVAISDIVSDQDVGIEMQKDPELWSGCISGAYREDRFLEAFKDVGFHGVQIAQRDEQPWRVVEGIEFRSMLVEAFKDASPSDLGENQTVIYVGPFAEIHDDEGRSYRRGERVEVSDRAYRRLQQPPYQGLFLPVSTKVASAADKPEGCCDASRT